MKKLYLLSTLILFATAAILSQRMNAQTVPVWDGAYTTWTQGSGTQADPYLIEIPQHLAWLAQKVNDGTSTYNGVYFRLTSDLDMNSLEWTPIGNSTTNCFKGIFDGNGHLIDNVYILSHLVNETEVNSTYAGLFGVIYNAIIMNLGVNSTITATDRTYPTYTGGIVAYVQGNDNALTSCYHFGNIILGNSSTSYYYCNKTQGYCGGIIGYIGGITALHNCQNNGQIQDKHLNTSMYNPSNCSLGGLIGEANATVTISDCFNNAVVYGYMGRYSHIAGGLVGKSNNGTITILNSHNESNITAGYCGGLVGGGSSSLNIYYSYNTGALVGRYTKGGLIGYTNSSSSITYSYNLGTLSDGIWQGGLVGSSNGDISVMHSYNKGTINNFYSGQDDYGGGIIGICNGTANISCCTNSGNVIVTTESSSSSVHAYSGGIIGYASNPISIDRCYNTAVISGLGTTGTSGYTTYGYVGGLVGYLNLTTAINEIHECYNTGSVNTGTVTGYNSCGGLVGNSQSGTSITNCYNTGTLTGPNNKKSSIAYGTATITNCYYLETCGGNAQTGAISKTSSQMQSPYFPGMLNSGVQAFVQDVSPYVNQGYPIFGDMVYAVSTQAATNVGVTKATLHGTYAGGADVAAFQYRENTTGSDWTTVNANIGSPVAYLLTGLQSNTTYIYRFMVQKNGGSYYGEEMTFTTGTCNLTASVTPSSVNICEGVSTTLTASAQSSLGNFFTYSWNTGAATSNLNVSNGGVYTVTVSDTNGCLATASANVVVRPQPVVGISGDTYLCMGQSGTLTATGGNTYAWSTGATTPSIPVSHGGTYSVTATNSYGCSGSASVTVTSLENLSIAGNTSFCNGQSTTLSVANGTGSYLWSTGATTSSIPVSQAGLYTVTVTLPNGCTSSVSASVSVAPTPVPTILGNTTICQNQTTTLTANGGVSYIWSNGSTTNSITVSQSGVYAVTATNAEGCSASTNVTITVNPLPNVNITGNSSFCQGDNTTLTATGASTYAWSNSSTVDAITVNAAGTYTVTGTDANGCTNTATKTVSVNPIYNIPLSHSICQGESYNFHGQNLTTAGTYTHTLQTVNGCDSILTLTLSVKPLPTPSISGNTSVCEGQSTTLTANGGNSYVWSNGSTNNNINISQSGIYSVIATNLEGCSASANVTVSVNPLPNVSINGNTTLCQGSNTTLTANGADSYSWSTGENTASINVSAFGIYTVTGTSAAGCSNTATATVIVSQVPVITITGNTELCEGETTTLTATGGSSYLWSNGTTDANLSVNTAGTYQVIGYNDAGCNTMAETTVHVWQPATSEFTITTTENCYEWNGQSYCQSGDYTQTLQTVHGCDSVVTLHLTITVGIDDYDLANTMMLYPNPTSDLVNVQLTINNEQLEEVGIQVFDVYGRLLNIVETGRAPSSKTTQFDLSRYAQGVYFVKAVSEEKVIAVRKVVKR